MSEIPDSTPVPVAELIAQLQHAQAEAKDAQVRLEALQRQYTELEGIAGTQADELSKLRKVEAAHASLQSEQEQLRQRLSRLQSQVNEQRSVAGTIRLFFWQLRRLPGLLIRGK